jgi:Ni,Fe-hydrogenase I small subunit
MSDYPNFDLLSNLNTVPPYTAAANPAGATMTVAEEEEALQRELAWWQSVDFTGNTLSGQQSRRPSASNVASNQLQLQLRHRKEAEAAAAAAAATGNQSIYF